MTNRPRRSRLALAASATLGSVGSTLLIAFSVPVQAQSPTAAPERIEITGSRIRSLAAISSSPLQVIDARDIAASGATNLQQLLLKNPVAASPAISRTNSNFSTSSAGVATIDLRNLGTSRTLVLINGRRTVAGVPGESAVDLNTIPTEFIERVEILTGGASSLYGSDAVAGVVNIVYKRHFDGLSLDAQVGQSEEGDDKKKKFSLTFGSRGNDGRTSLMGHLAFSDQGAVFSRDRDASSIDQISRGTRGPAAARQPGDLFIADRPFFSGFTPQGYFFTDNNTFTYNRAGQPVGANTNGTDGAEATGFNRTQFRTIALPTQRALLATKAEHTITDAHSVFMEGSYALTKTRTELEPLPLASNDILPARGGQVPAGRIVNGQLVRNPFVPDHIWNDISDTDGDGVPDYFFTRRMSEIGNRGNQADRDTFRFVLGGRGEIAGRISYDAYVGYGATKEAQTTSGQVNVLNFRNALDAVRDTNDVDGDGDRNEVICADADARAQGCVPINVFGRGAISPAAARYVGAPGSLTTSTTQRVAGVTFSGDAMQLPAGPLGYASGLEWRKEFARSEFDALAQAGLNGGNAIPPTSGGFDVTEAFVELRVPLLKDRPFVKALNATLSARASDYSTVGNVSSWNTGLEWSATADLKLRLSRTQSTRAPNINELFSPPSQTFPTGLSDPCVGVTATSTGTVSERCRATPGVNANITANGGTFAATQADIQGISGFDRGNPNLKEEVGRSTSIGVVYAPGSLGPVRNLTLTLDYFKVDIADAIVLTPRQFALSQCHGGNASFCRFVTRRVNATGPNSAGSISFVDSEQSNSGGSGVEGVDLTAAFALPLAGGRLNTRLAWTWLKDGFEVPLKSAPRDRFAGEIGSAKHKAALDLGYSLGAFGIRTTTTYIGKSAVDDQFLAGNFTPAGRVPAGSVTVPAKTYLDLQATWQVQKRVELYLGLDNALATRAPLIPSGASDASTTGAETDAATYDPIGRRWYLGVRASF